MKTCENCGLGIIWEGMIVETKTGHVCHPDCKPDHGAPAKSLMPVPGSKGGGGRGPSFAEAGREGDPPPGGPARPVRRGGRGGSRKKGGR